MSEFVNLALDLGERHGFAAAAHAKALLAGAGFETEIREGADDRTLAWIDDAFGGTWSGEAYASSNVIVTRGGAPVAFASFDPKSPSFAWLHGEGSQEDTGIFGPFGVDPEHRALRLAPGDTTLGQATMALALFELRCKGYARALIAAVGSERLVRYYERTTGAAIVERFDPLAHVTKPVRTVILASGSGTNAQAVVAAVAAGLPLDLCAVISNRAGAGVLQRAAAADIHGGCVLWDRTGESRARYDARLLAAVRAYDPQLVLLLGWMHLLDASFVGAFSDVLNIHPAFLPHDPERDDVGTPDGSVIPAFRGAHAVRDALSAKSPWVGASFHAVTMQTDRGAVIARKPTRVSAGEDASQVLERLHPIEHKVVTTGLRRWLYGR